VEAVDFLEVVSPVAEVVLVEAEPQEVGNEIQFKKFFITGRYR
jgi:hypothetical protein